MSEETFTKRGDGLWEHALPYPLMGVRKRCDCGRHFGTMKAYAKHWRTVHDGNRVFKRRAPGFDAVELQP